MLCWLLCLQSMACIRHCFQWLSISYSALLVMYLLELWHSAVLSFDLPSHVTTLNPVLWILPVTAQLSSSKLSTFTITSQNCSLHQLCPWSCFYALLSVFTWLQVEFVCQFLRHFTTYYLLRISHFDFCSFHICSGLMHLTGCLPIIRCVDASAPAAARQLCNNNMLPRLSFVTFSFSWIS